MATRLLSAPRIDFSPLRRDLDLPADFPPAVLAEAEQARTDAAERMTGVTDRTDIPFVTIDPPTSRDLDQAVHLERTAGGYRVHYAIADVATFVRPGGALDTEAWRRGQTVYLPDGRVPLHPPSLAEGAGSLLPDQVRPAALWTIELDRDGEPTTVDVRRAVVRSRQRLDYAGVQAAAAAGDLPGPIAPLPELGALLIERGLHRGAVNLPVPEQEVRPDGDGWVLELRPAVPAEEWNAQVSLLTGRCAATFMLEARTGVLRTMPAPRADAVAALRRSAAALGIAWPDGASVGAVVATVDPADPRGAAFVDHAAELMRGARYTAFVGEVPAETTHGAVAAPYAHVTAPLRRLVDRYATEVCLSACAGSAAPEWVVAALPQLPDVMATTDRRAAAAERGAVDLVEAVLLADRVGQEFDAVVVDVDDARAGREPVGVVALDEPPVLARCAGELPLGERVRVRLVTADPARRLVEFSRAGR